MSARALDALSQLDPLTQLVVWQIYGFTGSGPKTPELVAAEMGLNLDEVSGMLEAGLRALAGYRKSEEPPAREDSQKKTVPFSKPPLTLLKTIRVVPSRLEKLKLAKS